MGWTTRQYGAETVLAMAEERGSSVSLQTLIVESLRAEERTQRRLAKDRHARAYVLERDVHLAIADALGNLATSIEEGVVSE